MEKTFFAGCCLLAIFFTGFKFGTGVTHESYELISTCEKNLPRNQHCILQAVPASAEGVE